tara:strand:+ start:1615 stop:3684 length:2070 start_codon:yes stop_codon:yes gene_type:complete
MSTVGFGLKFTGDSRDAKRALKSVSSEIKSVGRAAKLMASPVAAGAAAVAAAGVAAVALARGAAKVVSTLAEWTAETAKLNDETAKNARNLGVTAETLQALGFAAERAGASSSSVAKGLKQLAVQAANAQRGSVQQVETFKRLGVEFETAGGAMRSTEAIFRDVADAIQKQGSSSRTTADLSILLGRAGAEMGNLMLGGSAGVDAMGARLEELGALQSGEALFAAEQYQDAMLDVQTATRGARMEIANEMIPAVTLLAETFADNVPEIRGFAFGVLELGANATASALGLGSYYRVLRDGSKIVADNAAATIEARRAVVDVDAVLTKLAQEIVEEQRQRAAAAAALNAKAIADAKRRGEAEVRAREESMRAAEAWLETTARTAQQSAGIRRGVLRLVVDEETALANRTLDLLEEVNNARAAGHITEQERVEVSGRIKRAQIDELERAHHESEQRKEEASAHAAERASASADLMARTSADAFSAAAAGVGELASIAAAGAKAQYGAQSKEARKAAKIAFVAQQGASLAIATVQMFQAIAAANALGLPASIPAMIAAGVIGGIQIAGIAATTIAGVADAGGTQETLGQMRRAGVTQVFNLSGKPEALITDPVGTSLLTNDLAGTFRTVRQDAARSEARDRSVRQLASAVGRGGGNSGTIRLDNRTTATVDGRILFETQQDRLVSARERGMVA